MARPARTLPAFALALAVFALAAPARAQADPDEPMVTAAEALLPANPDPASGRRDTASEPAGLSTPGARLELYGSLRLQLGAARVDEGVDGKDGYLGLSDAYSRVGAAARWELGGTAFTGRLELGIDAAEPGIGDPSFFDDEALRIKSVTATGDWGTLVVGKDWLPYYNAVGYPVDYFSTVYAGYTTYAFFREQQIGYTSPGFAGFRATLARIERTGSGPDGWQYVGTWTGRAGGGDLTLAVGREDMDSRGDSKIPDTQGASLAYTRGRLYLGAKYENSDAFGDIYNAFAQLTDGPRTWKLGVGLGDQFSGDTYHAGLDWRMSEDFKLFAEAYSEQRNYAVLRERPGAASDYLGAGGFGARQNGRVLAVGFRRDFSTND